MILTAWLSADQAKEDKDNNALIIPMPNGLNMAFMLVCVNPDDGFFNWKKNQAGRPCRWF